MNKKILIASDHAGFDLKEKILNFFKSNKFEDLGTKNDEKVDYPDFANKLASEINKSSKEKLGILICGSGNGMVISANRYKNVRAGLAFNPQIAKLIKEHNDANILVLPGRFMDVHDAIKCINNFLSSHFQGGRHSVRLKKIN